MARHLAVIAGPDAGQVFPLSDGPAVAVGRGRQALVRLTDLHVSRVHCTLAVAGDHLVLTDAGSTAGTLVNGRRVAGEQPLLLSDVIQIGQTQLRVAEDEIPDQPTLVPADRPAAPLDAAPATPVPDPAAGPLPAPAAPPLSPEAQLAELYGQTIDHYEVGPARARGRSGLVFRARDLRSGEDVALKIIRPEFMHRPEEVQRFFRAAQTVLRLRHPNLIALHEAGRTGPFCWLAMDWVEGESLTQVIDRIGVAGMLDWRYAARMAIHIGRALQLAHGHHVIHRNLTPQNVLVRCSDRAALLGDLALAKALEGELAQQITRPGEVIGDVRYMPPERLLGTEPVDERSDIYGLGALVYALLTGRPPFVGSSLLETLSLIRNAEPVPPKKYQLSIAGLFEGVVMKMLAKRPEDRFQTADDLLFHIDRAVKYQGVTV
jgi:Protein kinase domain/Inner membrane component of T3SS, cytoplasmic domain